MTAPGTTIAGRYRVRRRLGAGSMGSVWLARDTSLQRDVAVKSVRPPSAEADGGGQGEQRAMREARLIARVNHPNAVAIYDVVRHEDQPWLVMEYVPAQNLAELVQGEGPLQPTRAARLGAQVAGALADAHRAGVVHRDVKPANVLISEQGAAKITDFGIARGHDDVTLTATGTVWGTPAYLAPEVAAGAGPTYKADVWSLGATLYFAVERTPPYGIDATPWALLGRIAHQPVPPPEHAGALTPVLARLLDRDADRRPTMAEAVDLLSGRTPYDGSDAPAYPPHASGDAGGSAGAGPVGLPVGVDAGVDAPAARTRPQTRAARPRRLRRALGALSALLAVAAVGVAAWLLLVSVGGGETASPRQGPAASPTAGGPAAGPAESPTSTPSEPSSRPGSPEASGDSSNARRARFTPAAMKRAVADYYAVMPDRTRTGFSLLGPSLRSQGFATYDDFWDGIASVRVGGLRADPSAHTVTGTVVFVTEDGRTSTERHRFGLVADPSGDGLLIDTDTLL